jgi:hypothetical protein
MITAPAVVLLLGLAACGGNQADDTDSTGTDDVGEAAGACLAGSDDCDDIPTGTGGPESNPDGSVDVDAAVTAGIQGPFLISGFYLKDDSGERICSSLMESFPPQCGGTSLSLRRASEADLQVTSSGGVTWSESPLTFEGEIDGDAFVAR